VHLEEFLRGVSAVLEGATGSSISIAVSSAGFGRGRAGSTNNLDDSRAWSRSLRY